jgi:hypothetical protein
MNKIILLFCLLLLPLSGLAQNYSINWYKVAGGGGTSTNGLYSLSGTIGQPDASGAMTRGGYSLTGGFWSVVSVVQTPGLPNLAIRLASSSVIVSWPNTGSYTLQQTTTLPSGTWVTSSYSITTLSGTNSITITSPTGELFFRLANP